MQDARSIPLVTGNPENDAPASFARFVLPFAVRVAAADGPTRPRFVRAPSAAERTGYLTAETDRVLFERAAWFELDGWETPRFLVPRLCGGGRFAVEIRRPRLVLFEWAPLDALNREDSLATGFLMLDASFAEDHGVGPDLDDLLQFQELFRYWREPFHGHDAERGFSTVLGDCPVRFPPPSTRVAESGGDRYSERWLPLLDLPVEDGDRRWALWEGGSGCAGEAHGPDPDRFLYSDPRAFVWTCAVVEGGSTVLTDRFALEEPARHIGHWIKLLNVDSPGKTPMATAQSTGFERDWADDHTYRRWEELGSLYGFAYHGGAMLAPPLRRPQTWRHWAGHYFDQGLLLLYLRVTSFRFSGRLTAVTVKARGGRGERAAWRREFGLLRRDFALFTNLYEFPLVSNQQQGIEMYSLARRHLDVEDLFREVEKEIASAHEYFENEATQLQAQATMVLTLLATLGLPLALVMAFLGIEFVGQWIASAPSPWWALAAGCLLGLGGALLLATCLWWNRDSLTDRLARLGDIDFRRRTRP